MIIFNFFFVKRCACETRATFKWPLLKIFLLVGHIVPPPPPAAGETVKEKTVVEISKRQHLDATVLQWIYETISHDLLGTIIFPDTTSMQAWESLRLVFQDNKTSRAVYLEHQFNAVKLDNFPNTDSYFLELKTFADQLADVGAPVSNNRLVLRLIAGLNANYDGMDISLSRAKLIPPFTKARSSLILEELHKDNQAEHGVAIDATALLTTNDSDGHNPSAPCHNPPRRGGHNGGNNGGRGNHGGKKGRRGKNRGGHTSSNVGSPVAGGYSSNRNGVRGSGSLMHSSNDTKLGSPPLAPIQ